MQHTIYKVLWDNEHASGELPGEYATEIAAELAGENWQIEMCSIDRIDWERDENPYQYEVISIECDGCERCCTEDCKGCAYCYEPQDDYIGMGWLDSRGRP